MPKQNDSHKVKWTGENAALWGH